MAQIRNFKVITASPLNLPSKALQVKPGFSDTYSAAWQPLQLTENTNREIYSNFPDFIRLSQ